MKRLLDFDPLSGMKTFHDYDDSSDTTIISYEGDSSGVLDQCREDSNHADHRLGDLAHVARIPPEIQMKWFVEKGVAMWNPDHKQAVAKLLDGEYKYLKRLPIQIGGY